MRVCQRWCNSVRWYSMAQYRRSYGVADDRGGHSMANNWGYRVRYLQRLKLCVNFVWKRAMHYRFTYPIGVGVWGSSWNNSFNNWCTVGNWSNMFHVWSAVYSWSIAAHNWCWYQWCVSYSNRIRWSVGGMTNSIWGQRCPNQTSWSNSEE